MNAFGQYPFVRILIPFLAGIITGIQAGWIDTAFVFLFLFLLTIYTIDYFTLNLAGKFAWKMYNGIFLFTLLFLSGWIWVSITDSRQYENHYVYHTGKGNYLVQLNQDPVIGDKTVKAEVEIILKTSSGKIIPLSGKAQLYLRKEKRSMALRYGDELFVNTEWKTVAEPLNPGEFNYKNYLEHKHIYATGFADSLHWKIKGSSGSEIYAAAMYSRKKMMRILHKAGLEDQEYAVASALVLGYTGDINDEMKAAYSASGALHVLSVSGLHVAIIFAVFDKLLWFLLKLKNGKYYKAILILLILWAYAFLTGLSPSVMRSAAMLSFVVVGKLINRNASIYNILCASAFILLLFDPLLIADVGFQLSYLAVLGIVFFHPFIYNWFLFKNRIFDFIWNITAVSVAAQLITFPISIFYFHQFPNYFLLSNLIVIPLGTIILYNGILALVFSFVPGLNDFFIFTLKYLVKILNASVMWIESLPFSVAGGLHLSVFTCLLIYFILIFLCLYFLYKKSIVLKITLASVSLLFILFSLDKIKQIEQNKIVFYAVKKHTAIDFIQGKKHFFIADNELKSDSKKINYHISNFRSENGINNESEDELVFYKANFVGFNQYRLLITDSSLKIFNPIKKIKLDAVVITKSSKIKPEEAIQMFDSKIWIIDPSVNFYLRKKWKEKCGNKINLVFPDETGAFILNG